MKKYDAIIIGSGQAGTPLAKKIAHKGLKVAIIESKLIGGTCINYGCTPTKAMVASARVMHVAGTAGEVGVSVKGVQANFNKIIKRKNNIIEKARSGTENTLLKTRNLDVIYGEASFLSNKLIKIILKNNKEKIITGDKIFINTGARPVIPEIDGLDEIDYLDSTSIMELKVMPEHLLIVGASYIALEFGQMFRRFGSKVTILEHEENFLSKEDRDVAAEIKKFMEDEKVVIHTKATVQNFSIKNKKITASLMIDSRSKKVSCTHVLLAAGRRPNTEALHLENTGIQSHKGYIKVNDKLETDVTDVYALGDVKGGPAFTHISYNDYLIVCGNIYEDANESIKARMVPYTMFTDPQFARIGLNEKEAVQQKELNYKVACLPMTHVARGIETNETDGFIKAIVDVDSKQILGAAVIGEQGGEIMSMLQLAMMGKITYDELRSAVFAHPLYAEALNNLFLSLDANK